MTQCAPATEGRERCPEGRANANLIAWCRRNMAAYKYPRAVEFRDRLPMTATGKILKRQLAWQPEPAGARP